MGHRSPNHLVAVIVAVIAVFIGWLNTHPIPAGVMFAPPGKMIGFGQLSIYPFRCQA